MLIVNHPVQQIEYAMDISTLVHPTNLLEQSMSMFEGESEVELSPVIVGA